MTAQDDIMVDRLLADLDAVAGQDSETITAAQAAMRQDDLPAVPLRKMLEEQHQAQPDRLPWPDDWFDRRDPGDAAACQRLWGAVLLTCIRSAIGASADEDNGNTYVSAVPSGWVGSRDFHIVCALAGFDGQAVSDRVRRIEGDALLIGALRAKRQRVTPVKR